MAHVPEVLIGKLVDASTRSPGSLEALFSLYLKVRAELEGRRQEGQEG